MLNISNQIDLLSQKGKEYFVKFKHRIEDGLSDRSEDEFSRMNYILCKLVVMSEFKLDTYYFNVTSDSSFIFLFEFENEYILYLECFMSENKDGLNETVVFVSKNGDDIFQKKDSFDKIYNKLIDIFELKDKLL